MVLLTALTGLLIFFLQLGVQRYLANSDETKKAQKELAIEQEKHRDSVVRVQRGISSDLRHPLEMIDVAMTGAGDILKNASTTVNLPRRATEIDTTWRKIGSPDVMEKRIGDAFGSDAARTFHYLAQQIADYPRQLRQTTLDKTILKQSTENILQNLRNVKGRLPAI
ncbi:MAG: hypothetical protein QOH22_1911 [Gemmatimonadaceae bacterium]|jgi:hypothetical protein|nr:hypothetical protein [Gemmatimonadaceae bacterium]